MPDPAELPRQRAGTAPQMRGRYPDYDVLANAGNWDALTREVVLARVRQPRELRFFSADEAAALDAFLDVVLAQDREPRIPVLAMVDAKLADGRLDGFRYADLPEDPETWRLVARALAGFAERGEQERRDVVEGFAGGRLDGLGVDASRAWSVVMRGALAAFYSHPWAWNEIGFGGPAYPRGYMRLDGTEPHERDEALDVDPLRDPAIGEGA